MSGPRWISAGWRLTVNRRTSEFIPFRNFCHPPRQCLRHENRRYFHATSALRKKDYYEVLGIQKGASLSEIKKSYFQLAKKYHPDQNKENPSAVQKFQEATEAYEVLSNEEKRELYNRFGHAGVDGSAGSAGENPFGGAGFGGGFGGGFQSGGFQSLDELFAELFNQRRGPRRGQDIQYRLDLTFMEAVHGCEKKVTFQFQQMSADGRSRKVVDRDTTVQIPAGVDHGMTMQVADQGADGDPGMPRGNLLVQLTVADDAYFKRDDRRSENVHVEVPVMLSQAVLGATINVLTLNGMVDLKIPAGSAPGSRLVMRGKGIPRVQGNGYRGDMYVHLNIQIPKNLTSRQRELMEEFAKEEQCPSSWTQKVSSTFKRLRKYLSIKDEKKAA